MAKKIRGGGIQVVTDVSRDNAAALLRTYQAQQGGDFLNLPFTFVSMLF
ncbi:hypothetical protein [Desulfuromonas acetoxidans]|nr:hypothetical protein [Desulfuromonas acetoxidans]